MPDPKNPDENQPPSTPDTAAEIEETPEVSQSGDEIEITSADVGDVGDVIGDPIQPDAPENEPAGDPVGDAPEPPEQPEQPEQPDVAAVAPNTPEPADVGAVAPNTPDTADVAAVAPVIDKARRRATTAADKKIADTKRHDAAIEEAAADAPKPTAEVTASDERRDAIGVEMYELDEQAAALETEALKLREKGAELQLELYPQQGPNDLHSKAVRGYLDASARERAHRASSPARLKAMLKAAGLAPIDAAFQRQRARGMSRPKHPAKEQAPAASQDQSPGGEPNKDAAKQE